MTSSTSLLSTLVVLAIPSMTVAFTDAALRAQVTYAPLALDDKTRGVTSVGLQPSPWASLRKEWQARGLAGLFRSKSAPRQRRLGREG